MKSDLKQSTIDSPFAGIRHFFVLSPGGVVTGGPELLHQLVAEISALGITASVVYYPFEENWETPKEYLRYSCHVTSSIPDAEDCCVIVPEVATRILHSFSNARRAIWWLSVDNYRGRIGGRSSTLLYFKRLLRPEIRTPRKVIHLCQSKYAEGFVARRFRVRGLPLGDYLADEFLGDAPKNTRYNIVVYNPTKGARLTRRLMRYARDLEFVPIENMTRNEVRLLLAKAKAYIDFGPHPGKDRIPREAAASGCVVLVAKRGSAVNESDVAIPEAYKFPKTAVRPAIEMIRDVFADYEAHFLRQEGYREAISQERQLFQSQVAHLFAPAEIATSGSNE